MLTRVSLYLLGDSSFLYFSDYYAAVQSKTLVSDILFTKFASASGVFNMLPLHNPQSCLF